MKREEIIKQFGVSSDQAVRRALQKNAMYLIETGDGAALKLLPYEFDELLIAMLECRREYDMAYGANVK